MQSESWLSQVMLYNLRVLEDKRATTNVQNGLVFFLLFSFILSREGLNLKKSSWGKNCEKSVEKRPKRFCPLVVALLVFL